MRKKRDLYKPVRVALRKARAHARKHRMKGQAYAMFLKSRVLEARREVAARVHGTRGGARAHLR